MTGSEDRTATTNRRRTDGRADRGQRLDSRGVRFDIELEDVCMKKIPGYLKATLWIAIALAIGFIGSCAPSHTPLLPYDEAASQWDATVDKHVADPQRAGMLKKLGRQLDELQASLSADIAELNRKAVALNANYESTKDDARKLVAGFMQKRNAALAQYRDIIFAMRREVGAEEWKALME